MRKSILTLGILSLSFTSLPVLSDVTGSVTFVSDYVFRGVNFSNDKPAVQGSMDYSNKNFAAGVWGSSDASGGEMDLYLNYTVDVSEHASLTGGATRYYYPAGGSTTEYFAALGYKQFSAAYYYDVTLDQAYIEATASIEVNSKLSADFRAGQVSPDSGDSYYDLGVTLNYVLNERFTGFVGLTEHEQDDVGSNFILGISASF